MASILDRYGIKEVADVTFYEINANGEPGKPVLYLDTLKVSTIEQTAETADARGGKGNPKLISWDYGKEITVTLEDALFSAKSMSIMFGNGKVDVDNGVAMLRTAMAKYSKDGSYFMADVPATSGGAERIRVWLEDAVPTGKEGKGLSSSGVTVKKITTEDGAKSKDFTKLTSSEWSDFTTEATLEEGERVFVTYQITVDKSTITVSNDSFPGTYYVTGDTYARSDVTGMDQFFQFIIPKAKVTSENTITLEAEGDPSVFNMNLTVLRPESGDMMKLVQYELADSKG